MLLHLVDHLVGLPTWAGAYADDLLCLPLVLGAALLAHRLRRREAAFVLPAAHGLLAVGLFTVVFEMILPWLSARYTADPRDAVMYGAGFLVFQLGVNRPPALRRFRRSSAGCGAPVPRPRRAS